MPVRDAQVIEWRGGEGRVRIHGLGPLLPVPAQIRTLTHHTIHGLGVGYAEYGRECAEVIVDTATHLVCASVGSASALMSSGTLLMFLTRSSRLMSPVRVNFTDPPAAPA